MTHKPHDQLAKQLLEEMLSPLGEVQRSLEIPGEAKLVDLWFAPYPSMSHQDQSQDLLARIAQRCCLLEPFRNPPNRMDVRSCLLKLLWVQEDVRRKAEQQNRTVAECDWPSLWIIGTSLPKTVLEEYGASISPDWGDGVYCAAPGFGMNFIAVNELPRTRETLILRVLGRGNTQRDAVLDVFALSDDEPQRFQLLRILSNWKLTLELGEIELDEPESMMAFSQAFLEWEEATEQKGVQKGLEQGLEQGLELGEKSLLIRLLTKRIGSIAPNLTTQIQSLSLQEIEALGEALLEFDCLEDLQQWLKQH